MKSLHRRQGPGRRRPAGRRTCALALLVAVTGAAADRPHNDHDHDHDRARAALERGEVLPLAEILHAVSAQVSGDVVEVELEREEGAWIYELKIIDALGRVREVYVDAASGTPLPREHD
jgi:uncharacterized membrane protein YkoI